MTRTCFSGCCAYVCLLEKKVCSTARTTAVQVFCFLAHTGWIDVCKYVGHRCDILIVDFSLAVSTSRPLSFCYAPSEGGTGKGRSVNC